MRHNKIFEADMRFVKSFTLPDFQAKTFTPSISPILNGLSDKNTNKLSYPDIQAFFYPQMLFSQAQSPTYRGPWILGGRWPYRSSLSECPLICQPFSSCRARPWFSIVNIFNSDFPLRHLVLLQRQSFSCLLPAQKSQLDENSPRPEASLDLLIRKVFQSLLFLGPSV